MTTTISRFLAPVALLEWGLVLLYIYFSGRINNFLHPGFFWLVLLVGFLLVATSVVLFWPTRGSTDCCHDGCHTHDNPSHLSTLITSTVLVIPIGLATIFSPNEYSENMLRNRMSAHSDESYSSLGILAPRRDDLPLKDLPEDLAQTEENTFSVYQNPALIPDTDGNIRIDVPDLLFAAADPPMRRDFSGKRVTLIGQVAHRNNAKFQDGNFKLIRFSMVCCAADARPLSVLVLYPEDKPSFEAMSWVRIIAIARFKQQGDAIVPVLDPIEISEIDRPENIYLY